MTTLRARGKLFTREFEQGDDAYMLVRVKLVTRKRPHVWYVEDEDDHAWDVSEVWLERVEDVER